MIAQSKDRSERVALATIDSSSQTMQDSRLFRAFPSRFANFGVADFLAIACQFCSALREIELGSESSDDPTAEVANAQVKQSGAMGNFLSSRCLVAN
jgi:hypothetical protein